MAVPDETIGRYGIVAPVDGATERVIPFSSIVEKPDPEDAPSNLAAVGRYVFTAEIFDHLRAISRGVGNEYQLTDAINRQALQTPMDAIEIQNRRYDCGSKIGYFEALVDQALERPDTRDAARALLKEKLSKLPDQGA
jgi:UTP--glucose-1-phosphate uridylyltransferase